ncbi:basic leucine zipper 23 isoform X1 [Eucalyptus grandis]|uniref:basic leucine zipper 23 isoform X1 n=1 Tax=Eucalyptus grandis TaxID=71139 RepID=UPI00192EA294|nr:basic leucine zipper 23 isoform X1 [Eucalyptus grandis]XP_039174248.1 basic leucine zipper 23 isoform X1 [Eucalyptus grandis]XP_039174249.1 basic leucine zipper 23 isoform X1 [Eucalyptus grandis]
MDDGEVEVEVPDPVLVPNASSSSSLQSSASVDSLIEEFLKNTRTCTHTHTCNPPGPDAAHTHTCFHTHTQMFSSEDDEKRKGRNPCTKVKTNARNKVAVRKYREKKKAHTACLEQEVQELRMKNQQLNGRLHVQANLYDEVIRLRRLLLDLRGKIDYELGLMPFQKPCNYTSIKEGDCGVQSGSEPVGLQCSTGLTCFHPHTGSSSLAGIGRSDDAMVSLAGENCQPAIGDCQFQANVGMNSDGHNSNTVQKIASTTSQVE